MYSFGFVDEKYKDVSRRVCGGTVVTAPHFDPDVLESTWAAADFIYIDLHGRPDQPKWLFAGGNRVIGHGQIHNYARGKVIFATTCYLPGTAWFDELRDGNVLVYGFGENYGGKGSRAIGAQLLALWFRRMLELGMSPRGALRCAKLRLVLTSWRRADRDALSFTIAPPTTGAAREESHG